MNFEKMPTPSSEKKEETSGVKKERLSFAEEIKLQEEKKLQDAELKEAREEELKLKKGEYDILQKERLDYYVEAKAFEDKMNSFDLSDEKKKEVRERIMEEGGEIGEKMQEMREEYGLELSKEDVYGARVEMLQNEYNRIDKTLKELLKYNIAEIDSMTVFNSFNADCFKNPEILSDKVLNAVARNKGSHPNVPEYHEFIGNIDKIYENQPRPLTQEAERDVVAKFYKLAQEYKDEIDSQISKNPYSVESSKKAAESKLPKLKELIDRSRTELNSLRETGKYTPKEDSKEKE